jgi:hypothetical protein
MGPMIRVPGVRDTLLGVSCHPAGGKGRALSRSLILERSGRSRPEQTVSFAFATRLLFDPAICTVSGLFLRYLTQFGLGRHRGVAIV